MCITRPSAGGGTYSAGGGAAAKYVAANATGTTANCVVRVQVGAMVGAMVRGGWDGGTVVGPWDIGRCMVGVMRLMMQG